MAEPEEAARAFIPPLNNSYLDESRLAERYEADGGTPIPGPDASGRVGREGLPSAMTVSRSASSTSQALRDPSRSTRGSDTLTLADTGAGAVGHKGANAKGSGDDVRTGAGKRYDARSDGEKKEDDAYLYTGDLGDGVGKDGVGADADAEGRAGGQGQEEGGKKAHGRGLTEGDAGMSYPLSLPHLGSSILKRAAYGRVCRGMWG